MTVGERIRSEREYLGISQTDLAKRVGVSKQTLYKYETNVITNIPSNIIENIATVLNISPCILMGWDTEQIHTYHLCQKEEKLISDFRTLNAQGQNYILQTMDMVKDKYKKSNTFSCMEEII